MMKLNLQYFGGRGSAGARSGGGGGIQVASTLDQEMSEMWSEQPDLYQALSDPERFEATKRQLMADGWDEEDVKEFKGYADDLKNAAETGLSGQATLYRGERFNSMKEAQAKYHVGAEIITSQMTSYATEKSVAQNYANYYGKTPPKVVITNTSTTGNFVGVRTNHLGIGADEEAIVPKGVTSKVTSTRLDKASNTLYVTMENSAKPRRKR